MNHGNFKSGDYSLSKCCVFSVPCCLQRTGYSLGVRSITHRPRSHSIFNRLCPGVLDIMIYGIWRLKSEVMILKRDQSVLTLTSLYRWGTERRKNERAIFAFYIASCFPIKKPWLGNVMHWLNCSIPVNVNALFECLPAYGLYIMNAIAMLAIILKSSIKTHYRATHMGRYHWCFNTHSKHLACASVLQRHGIYVFRASDCNKPHTHTHTLTCPTLSIHTMYF